MEQIGAVFRLVSYPAEGWTCCLVQFCSSAAPVSVCCLVQACALVTVLLTSAFSLVGRCEEKPAFHVLCSACIGGMGCKHYYWLLKAWILHNSSWVRAVSPRLSRWRLSNTFPLSCTTWRWCSMPNCLGEHFRHSGREVKFLFAWIHHVPETTLQAI